MSTLLLFVQKIVNSIQASLVWLVSLPGLILSAITGFFTFLVSLVSDSAADVLAPATDIISDVTDFIQSINTWAQYAASAASQGSAFGDFLRYIVAIDSLVADAVIVITATVGVLGYAIFSFISAILAVLLVMFSVRGIQKVVSIFSAGYVKT